MQIAAMHQRLFQRHTLQLFSHQVVDRSLTAGNEMEFKFSSTPTKEFRV